MTKSEDDTANEVDEAKATKPGRHGWRRRSAAPRDEAATAPESKAEELTIESTVEAPTIESTVEAPAADTVVAPRIRGAAADSPDAAASVDVAASVTEDDEPTPLDASEADDADVETPEPSEADVERIQWSRVLAYGVLPGLALLLALTAGFLKYVDNSVRDNRTASIESVQAAKDSTVTLLSYKPETVEKQLGDARSLLTGEFQQSYTDLTTNVVIPGAKQQQISASARVPAAASVSADSHHAVVLVFVNQTVVIGTGAPSDTASSVRVTLDKVGDKWLISKFDPV